MNEIEVGIKNFILLKLLGKGAYGKVFLVEKLDGIDKGRLYALKVLEKSAVTQNKKTIEQARSEREVNFKTSSKLKNFIILLRS